MRAQYYQPAKPRHKWALPRKQRFGKRATDQTAFGSAKQKIPIVFQRQRVKNNLNSQAVAKRLRDKAEGGIPWTAILDESGKVRASAEEPRIVDARVSAAGDGIAVDVTVHVAPHTATQTPVTSDDGPAYGADATYLSIPPFFDAKPHAPDCVL